MSKNKLSEFTTAELKSVHEDSFGNDYNIKEAFGLNKPQMRTDAAGRKRPTRRQAKKDLEKTFGVYKNEEADNWRKVRESMGIKDVNSNSDFAAMKREVAMEIDRRSNEKATKGLRKRITELENRPVPTAQPEAQPEAAKAAEKPTGLEPPSMPERPSMLDDQINNGNKGFDASKYDWAPAGGSEAPGQAEYAKAKEKAQAFSNKSGTDVDYSFEGGSYGDKPEEGTDMYGNATPDKAKEEHANDLLNKYKSDLVSSGK